MNTTQTDKTLGPMIYCSVLKEVSEIDYLKEEEPVPGVEIKCSLL